MNKKYGFTEESITVDGRTLHRIKALRDFGYVKAGYLGGFIEKEDNLSHEDTAWVCGNAKVFGNARVSGNARVYGSARVWGNAGVSEDARVYGSARVSGNAGVSGNVRVWGNAGVSEDARVYGSARVSGNAWVFDNAQVYGSARVFDNAQVYGSARVSGNARVSGYAMVGDSTRVFGVEEVGLSAPQAKKDDTSKPPLALIPPRAMFEVAKAFDHGAKKYGTFNFMIGEGFTHLRLCSAAMRHIAQHVAGEDIDQDSGDSHLSHAVASLMMLIELIHAKQPIKDDRWVK